MSSTELLLEYHTSRRFENDKLDTLVKGIKETIISTFGLSLPNLIDKDGGLRDVSKMTKEEQEAFTPFVFFVAHREMIKKFLDSIEEQKVTVKALSDAEFEKQSQEMEKKIKEEGDIVPVGENQPILTDNPEDLDKWLQEMNIPTAPPSSEWAARNQEDLKRAGVVMLEKDMGTVPKAGGKVKVKVDEDG